MRVIVAIIMLLILTVPVHAKQPCRMCKLAKEAQAQKVVGLGRPNKEMICFDLLMTDPSDSVIVSIYNTTPTTPSDFDHPTRFEKFRVGAVQRTSGDPNKPMACIHEDVLEGAVYIRVIPGSNETCANLYGEGLARLISRKKIGAACLRASCNPKGTLEQN